MAEEYFIGVDAAELERLRDQHAHWLPETQALWRRAGFERARHIADLGSGPGYTTFDLACLAPGASVTAIDNASSFLAYVAGEAARRELVGVQTLECDLAREALGAAPTYDAAFCRFVLAFVVGNLDAVIARIHASLEPGGTFAAMEYLTLCSTTCSPPLRGFDAHTRAWIDYYRANGADSSIGAVLPSRLEAGGFTVESIDCVGGMARAGTRWWKWWGRLMTDFGAKLVSAGLMSEAERRELAVDWTRASNDPLAFIHTPVVVQIVAHKR